MASSHHDHFRAELKASKAFSKFQQLFFVSNVQKMVLWIHHHTVKNVKLFFSVISATSAKLLCYCTMRLHCFGLSWDELLTSGYCPEKYGHLDFKNATTLLGKYNSFNKIIELKNEIFETAMKNFIRWPFARDSTGHYSLLYCLPYLAGGVILIFPIACSIVGTTAALLMRYTDRADR